jgi:integrase
VSGNSRRYLILRSFRRSVRNHQFLHLVFAREARKTPGLALTQPKKAWERVLASAGIDDLRIHDLRRTLGSWQAKTGASLAIIGKSLNHRNQNTTAIYARLDLDPVRDSVNTATSAIMAAAGLKPGADVVKIGGKTAINSENEIKVSD